MAHSASARKRIRQNVRHRSRNRWRLRAMRNAIRDFNTALNAGKFDEAAEAFKACQKVIDRTAQQGTIHKNHASRRKSRLNARLKAARAAA